MNGIRLTTVTLGASDAVSLARFYARLLGWSVGAVDDATWVAVRDPAGGVGIACQQEKDHVRPSWPSTPGGQQMQIHLEIQVDDLQAGLRHALQCGATMAPFQPQSDVRVCLDPAGHPFCLWIAT
jgi:predicted enzyme related to lactoylglutathione lyase